MYTDPYTLGFDPVAWHRQCVLIACSVNEPRTVPKEEFTGKFSAAVKASLESLPESDKAAALAIANEFSCVKS